jgi:hypothetical protein
MQGVVTLRIEQYREYRLSIINGSPKFLHIIYTFVTPCYTCKQCGESQLSVINDTEIISISDSEESMKNCKHLLEFDPKFEKPSDTE